MSNDVTLVLATQDDAQLLHEMKYEAFLPLYEKYHDDETTPVKESVDRVLNQIKSEHTDYFIICWKGEKVGAIRIADKLNRTEYVPGVRYISPFYILPKYQNLGIGYTVLQKIFEMYQDTHTWRLDTIQEEAGNCHLYEKCGFVRVGEGHMINEYMTLVDYEKTVTK
ncbi:MAG: GNAT family N-acetyltransferase [Lachnospiraceae bacterium]|nr:GNAT family N-acetyltransferase [Lachnospiraceae bacterium]